MVSKVSNIVYINQNYLHLSKQDLFPRLILKNDLFIHL